MISSKLVRVWLAACCVITAVSARADAFNFSDLPLGAPGTDGSTEYGSTGTYYWNGSNGAGSFGASVGSSTATFVNTYGGGFWDGFAYSNTTDMTTPGFANQYSAITGGGFGGSSTYVVGFQPYVGAWDIGFSTPLDFEGGGLYLTNTTYTYFTLREGDTFAKKFGGPTGDDPDWFLLTIEGWSGGSSLGTVEFYLADYRFENPVQDYILDEWTFVDLSAFSGEVDALTFGLSSSDVGEWGMNTPAYFALGGIVAVPEPATGVMALLGIGGLAWLSARRRQR